MTVYANETEKDQDKSPSLCKGTFVVTEYAHQHSHHNIKIA